MNKIKEFLDTFFLHQVEIKDDKGFVTGFKKKPNWLIIVTEALLITAMVLTGVLAFG